MFLKIKRRPQYSLQQLLLCHILSSTGQQYLTNHYNVNHYDKPQTVMANNITIHNMNDFDKKMMSLYKSWNIYT